MSDASSIPVASPIRARGEMADLVRNYAWETTPLGPLSTWSETILSAANLMLTSQFPSVLQLGPELNQLYNDAFLPLMAEKHPRALGQAARECWQEAWHILRPQYDSVLTTGEPIYQQDVLVPVTRDGVLKDVYWTYSYSPVFEPGGAIVCILIVCHDVTDEILATRERDALAEKLNSVLQATTDGVVSIDHDWCITYINQPAKRIIFPVTDVIGGNHWELFPGCVYPDSPYLYYYYRAMNEGIAGNFEAEYGEPLNITAYIQVRPSSNGIILFFRDVTEERKTQQALLQTEKLAAVGRLAASVAHEINNPLESVTNLIYLATHSETLEASQEFLEIAERELRRVAAITNQTLRFYKQTTNPTPATCQELLDGVVLLHQGRLINSRIEVERRKRATHAVLCFEGEIRQVLNNLVANAIDAMHPDGGRLLVRSREGTDWKTGRQGLKLTIADTGSGMPPAAGARIFEAFYTTKGFGGTGLGLWVSCEIVKRHHGQLRFRTSQRAGRSGTVFTLFLPFDAALR